VNAQARRAGAGPRTTDRPCSRSMAIIEYLDEMHPEPPLLPKDPKRPRPAWRRAGADRRLRRATPPHSCRASATTWKKELSVDEAARTRWCQHWVMEALEVRRSAPSRKRKGNRPLLATAMARNASRHLHCDPRCSGPAFFQTATTALVPDRDAGCFKRVHEAGSLRQIARPLKQPGAPKENKATKP